MLAARPLHWGNKGRFEHLALQKKKKKKKKNG
jgi:hypothetical protein